MPGGHALTAATTTEWVGATGALVISVLVAALLRVLFSRRTRRLAETVLRGELPPEVDTRLRLVERLLEALVIVIGISIALSKFDVTRGIGRTLLTSGAITAAIVGFAARQTLANVVAGLMIAVTQPVRLGDHVTFGDDSGVVEDVSLSYTVLRTGGNQRILIPNEKLTSGVLRNDSLVDAPVSPDVSVWIAPDADVERAVEALRETTGADVSVAEVTTEGVRLTVAAPAVSPPDRAAREAELRYQCVQRLYQEGLLPHP
jgi:small-conductance mechanosensitive channel